MSKKYNEIFRQVHNSDNIEETMEILKNSGASQMDTLKVLMDELHLSIRDADNLVMNAKIWRDNKEINQGFRDSATDALNYFQIDNLLPTAVRSL